MDLVGSGTLSHVYIRHPPLRCSIPETRGLFYDDGNKLLLSPTSDQVLSWKIGSSIRHDPPNSDSISEGAVLLIRYSLDGKIIGIQRSNSEIQFKNRETGETISRRYRPESECILGFFWTDCPVCDIVVIKTSGLDLLAYESEFSTFRLVEAKRFNVSWYVYTHESRLILLASGMQCKVFSGFQFSSAGIVRLPKFEMTMTKSEANQKPVLAAEDIHIVTVYGRIYCLQVDRIGGLLHLYRFYRDAVVHQGSLPIYSTRIAVSVVDNVILVHQVDAKVVILYDIFLDSLVPVSAPLPLLLRGVSAANASSSQGNTTPAVPMEAKSISGYEGIMYGDSWNFLVPDLICDTEHGMLWRLHLDLEAIAASSSEVPSVLEFLQRRRSEPTKIKQLCLGMMRTIILERRPISMISRATEVLVTSHSQSIKMGTASQGGHGSMSSVRSSSVGENAQEPRSHYADSSSRRAVNKPQQSISRDTEKESLHPTAVCTVSGHSAGSVLDYEGNAQSEQFRTNSGDFDEKSFADDLHASGARDERESNTPEIFVPENGRSQFHPKELEPDSDSLDSNACDKQVPQNTSVSISPEEMYRFVFALVEEEMAGDLGYLVSVIVEFLRSASIEKLNVPSDVYVMIIQLLARSGRYAELALFILNKIVEPSKEVALLLLESGHHNFQRKKLGMDMLRQLSFHHEYVLMLVEDGYYLEALRYARKNKVTTVHPSTFLEAALSTNDSQHLAAVLRFFSDFIPGFKATADHSKYCQILNEMN
uniref:Uncharacterized protein C18orf8 n=2 Tax=Anthurium amnicola TaxID=1678845 RepID=A0A1D1ZDB1_9ARAE